MWYSESQSEVSEVGIGCHHVSAWFTLSQIMCIYVHVYIKVCDNPDTVEVCVLFSKLRSWLSSAMALITYPLYDHS